MSSATEAHDSASPSFPAPARALLALCGRWNGSMRGITPLRPRTDVLERVWYLKITRHSRSHPHDPATASPIPADESNPAPTLDLAEDDALVFRLNVTTADNVTRRSEIVFPLPSSDGTTRSSKPTTRVGAGSEFGEEGDCLWGYMPYDESLAHGHITLHTPGAGPSHARTHAHGKAAPAAAAAAAASEGEGAAPPLLVMTVGAPGGARQVHVISPVLSPASTAGSGAGAGAGAGAGEGAGQSSPKRHVESLGVSVSHYDSEGRLIFCEAGSLAACSPQACGGKGVVFPVGTVSSPHVEEELDEGNDKGATGAGECREEAGAAGKKARMCDQGRGGNEGKDEEGHAHAR